MSSPQQYNLPPYQNIPLTAVSSTQTVTSLVTNIYLKKLVSLQFVWTGTLTGTFSVQVSSDYDPHKPTNATWTPMTFSVAPVTAGSAGNVFIDIVATSAVYLRVVYTNASGSGNLTSTISAKG